MNILGISLSAGILIIIITGLRFLNIRKIPQSAYLLLWEIVMVRLLVPISIPVNVSLFEDLNRRINDSIESVEKSDHSFFQMLNPTEYENITVASKGQSISTMQLLMIIWLIGMLLILVINLFRLRNSHQIIREAIPIKEDDYIRGRMERWTPKRKIRILTSDRILTPFTLGIIHPKILLPKNMDYNKHNEVNYVLVHELVHVIRQDNLWRILSFVAVLVHWFNPLVWLMYSSFHRDMEMACDEKVISLLGESKKTDYAMTLIQLAEKKSRLIPLYNSFSKNAVEERIVSIMKYKKITRLGVILSVIMVLLTGTTFITYAKEKSEYNPLYDQTVNKELYIAEEHEKKDEARQYFPINENGYTYGNDQYGIDVEPDLMAVENEDGISGYCYSDDLTIKVASIEEAFASMEKWKDGRSVLIYESDGETILGIFKISKAVTR
jgi:beta-lactamase regulating signal transducer with metallopeptidase domain